MNRPRSAARRSAAALARARAARRSSAGCRSTASVRDFIAAQAPDAVLITPLVGHRLAAARSLRRGAAARAADGAAGRQLGSPVEQGAAARLARCAAGLERGAEARGGGDARRARRSRASSPARSATTSGWAGARRDRARSSARASACARPSVPPLRLLVALPRHGRRAGVRRATGSQALRSQRRPAAEGHRHPGAAAPGAARRMARRRSVRLPQRRRSGARTRWMRSRRTTTSIRCTTAPRVVGLNTSAFIESGVRRQARAHRAAAGDLDAQPGRHDPLPLPAGRQRRAAARGAQLRRARDAARRGARRRRRRRSEGGERSPTGSSGRSASTMPATPRFVDALEARGAAAPPARGRPASRRLLWRVPLSLVAGVLALNVRTQPWREARRNRVAQGLPHRAPPCAASTSSSSRARALGKRPRRPRRPPSGSALTPSWAGHGIRPRQLAGWDLEEARETRELVTVLGRSGRPIIARPVAVRDRLRAALLDSVPGLGEDLRQFRPRAARGGVARRRRAVVLAHHAATTRTCLSFYTPDEFRQRNERAHHRAARAAEAHGGSAFDREILATACSGARPARTPSCCTRRRCTGCSSSFWFQRAPMTLVEAFTQFSTLPPPSRWRAARAAAGAVRRREVLRQRGPARHAREPRVHRDVSSTDLAQHIDVVLLNTGHRFDDHEDVPPQARGRHAHGRAPDDAGGQSRGADARSSATPRRSSAPTAASRIWRRSAASTRWRSTRTRRGSASTISKWPSACSPGLRGGAFVELRTRARSSVVSLGFGRARRGRRL